MVYKTNTLWCWPSLIEEVRYATSGVVRSMAGGYVMPCHMAGRVRLELGLSE